MNGDPSFTIVEAYYDNEGNIDGWSELAFAFGDSIEELAADLRYMMEALLRPVLNEAMEEID